MFLNPTVLILGAGASVPYGFPTGAGLINEILRTEDTEEIRLRQKAGFSDVQMDRLKEALMACQSSSIDSFLSYNPDFEDIGRFLIAQRITTEYDYRKLFLDPIGEYKSGKWYRRLVNSLGDTPQDLKENKLSIITFNYDLSLDYYLTAVISARQQCSIPEAIERLKHIRILHVHGTVGKQPAEGGLPLSQGYTRPTDHNELLKTSKEIKVIRGRVPRIVARGPFADARKLLEEATYIFILGFGFHTVNIMTLGLDTIPTAAYTCTYGITAAEYTLYKKLITLLVGEVNDGNIVHFMRNCQEYVNASTDELL